MKPYKIAGLLLLSSITPAFAVSNITDTASFLQFDFSLSDNNDLDLGDADGYVPTNFPGLGFLFTFADGWYLFDNVETLTTAPLGSSPYVFNQESGALNFGGSYSYGGSDVTWSVESIIGSNDTFRRDPVDTWTGTLTARTSSVPDGGSTVILLGLGISGLAFSRRRFRKTD